MIRRATLLIASLWWLGAGVLAFQAPAQGGDTGFVPVTELPPGNTLPAAPFLEAAYAFIWIALLAYVWTIWRRLGKVEREMHELERRRK